MNTEKIVEEIIATGNRKVNIGVRAFGELKYQLGIEAKDLGISLCEYSENILINRKNNGCKELEAAVVALNEEVDRVHVLLNDSIEIHQNEMAQARFEINELKRKVAMQNQQLGLFQNTRLLELFAKAKGKKDEIELPDGQKIQITYNTTKDVLTALIYSFKF